jgi:hypothetical protein
MQVAGIARKSFQGSATGAQTVLQRVKQPHGLNTLFDSMRQEFTSWKSKRPPLLSQQIALE